MSGLKDLAIMNDGYVSSLLIDHIKGKLIYLYEYRKWIVYEGGVWKEDVNSTIHKIVDEWLTARAEEASHEENLDLAKYYYKSLDDARRNAIVNSIKRLSTNFSIANFNKDRSLVNLKNGTYDTKLKLFRKHSWDDLLTCQFNCDYDPNAISLEWNNFIERIDSSRDERFLQKAIGSNLLGKNFEEKLFILYGLTQTGKSTFTESILNIFGGYGKKADSSTFLDTRTDTIRNDLARLKDARLVVSGELKKGAKIDNALIKALTGNDKMTVRPLYGEYFEYDVTYNIWLATNYFPRLDSEDDAVWRRVIAIPFKNKFKNPDPGIKDKFFNDEETKSAILNWIIEGYYLYKEQGLEISESIYISNSECRLAQMDLPGLSLFLQCDCEMGEEFEYPRARFYKLYEEFCKKNDIPPEGKKIVFKAMRESGFIMEQATKGPYHHETVIRGLCVVVSYDEVVEGKN